MVITLAQSKGGAGKSTITLNLAAVAAKSGANVLILDTDPQKTLTEILTVRDETSEALSNLTQFTALYTISKDLPTQLSALSKKFDMIFIDTAGFDNALTWSLIAASDLALIPVALGAADLLTTTKMIEKLSHVFANSPVKARLVMNQFQPACRYAASYKQDIQNLAAVVPVTQTAVHARPTYKEAFAFGVGVCELLPSSAASQEMQSLFTEITSIQ